MTSIAIAIFVSMVLYAIGCLFVACCMIAAGRADEREREMNFPPVNQPNPVGGCKPTTTPADF